MKREELIKKYIEFFKTKNHSQISNESLIPENDPTVLFTTAGMHPLVPFLSGQKHSSGKRLVGLQKCIRTGDIEEVGDTMHHTFFEMLGNWSLGDYEKEDAIKYSFEFLTNVLKIPVERLAVSVFVGDENAGKDEVSAKIWEDLGILKKRIIFLDKKENWWGPAGKTGPCGPDTEMFYWKKQDGDIPEKFDSENENWIEIWNDVFMEYEKDDKGNYNEAKQKNIDTGMGVERTIAILNGFEDNYLSDMWRQMIEKIEILSKHSYDEDEMVTKSMRVIADHIKAAVFMISDGVVPGNSEQGYVLRRLIRRAIRFGRVLGIEQFTTSIADTVYMIYKDYNLNMKKISIELQKEENKFLKTLEQGLRIFDKLVLDKSEISGKNAFLLFQSYGFPIEITQELACEKNIEVDVKGYENEFLKHKKLSQTASAGNFKSGLSDNSKETTKLHTIAHLLSAALNKVLKRDDGERIEQRGSNITAERLRFDFSFDQKLTEEEILKIETLINSWIKTGEEVVRKEMSFVEAKKIGADGIFEDKYAQVDKLSVYIIDDGNISKEICSGPHVKSLKAFNGLIFKIVKQKSVGSGVRRVRCELIKE